MAKDIVPSLLEKIEKEFDKQHISSEKIHALLNRLENEKATYKDAHEYAVKVGELLSNVLKTNITVESLPDGKMYFNIAERVFEETLKNNYIYVSDYVDKVQNSLNHQVGLRLKVQHPEFNKERLKGFVNKMSSADDFSDVQWMLGDPNVNFTHPVSFSLLKESTL